MDTESVSNTLLARPVDTRHSSRTASDHQEDGRGTLETSNTPDVTQQRVITWHDYSLEVRQQAVDDSQSGDDRASMEFSARRTSKTTLRVQTQEGDSVRLKISASEKLSVEAEQETEDGRTITEMEVEAKARTRIAIRIKGDLNEAEFAAIQSVIEQAGEMANEFYNGNADSAFAAAGELQLDATQLASATIHMRSSMYMDYQASGELSLPGRVDKPSSSGDMPTESPAQQARVGDVQADPSSGAAVEPIAGGDIAGSAPAGEPPVEGAEDASKSGTAEPVNLMASMLQSIGGFLHGLMETFGGINSSGNDGAQGNLSFKLEVFSAMLLAIEESRAEPTEEDEGAALAAETLNVLAASQVPLDEVA